MNEPVNFLGGTKEPTETNQYLASDGLYYNGYMQSFDASLDAFGECFERIKNHIAKSIFGGP